MKFQFDGESNSNFIERNTGQTMNYIENNPAVNSKTFQISYKENSTFETPRGIRLGSTIGDVYASYGPNIYVRKCPSDMTYLNDENHTATNNAILHYGITDKNICYQLGIVFDQSGSVISISCAPHKLFSGCAN